MTETTKLSALENTYKDRSGLLVVYGSRYQWSTSSTNTRQRDTANRGPLVHKGEETDIALVNPEGKKS